MTLYNKIIAIGVSFLIISMGFLFFSINDGKMQDIMAYPNFTYENNTQNISYNSSLINSYGYGGILSIFSSYVYPGVELPYAYIFEKIYIKKETLSGNNWVLWKNYSVNMSLKNFYLMNIHLVPGRYKFMFGTLIDYRNQSAFINGTLPPSHNSFMLIDLPYPSILVDLIVIEILLLVLIAILDYRSILRKNRQI
ncbi:hypothetical protein ACNF42_03960 [Cuniculiplasma sp. SKW3]|uniref:hypothetical protein n=1 Tax=Cuniculiplasma sp. SKW3 TaxID=3400170 RepID=UPI003FD40954